MHKPPYRWGIIGPGLIAQKFAEAVELTSSSVIYAVASRDIRRAHDSLCEIRSANATTIIST